MQLSKLAAARESGGISLRRRPGTKHRSSVRIPGQAAPGDELSGELHSELVDLDSISDDDHFNAEDQVRRSVTTAVAEKAGEDGVVDEESDSEGNNASFTSGMSRKLMRPMHG